MIMLWMKVKARLKKKLLKTLGQRIRGFRNKLGISQETLAFQIGVDRTYIGTIEQGLRSPSIYCLYVLSKARNISLKDLAEIDIVE